MFPYFVRAENITITTNTTETNGGFSDRIYTDSLTLNPGVEINTAGNNESGVKGTHTNMVNIFGDIITHGEWSSGVALTDNNIVDISGNITTANFQAKGVKVYDENTMTFSGNIDTSGAYGDGISGWTDNTVVMSGTILAQGRDAVGLHLIGSGNAAHISNSISSTDSSYYSNALSSGLTSGTGETNIFHLLNGTSLTGNINNNDSDDGGTAFLTFGYATDGNKMADTTSVDNAFSLTFDDKIKSASAGNWDGYFAGGTTTLNGDENAFRNIFIGAKTFDGAAVPDGSGGTVLLNGVAGASADLNITDTVSTSGKITIGSGSTYTLSGTHTHTGTDMTVNGQLNLNDGTFVNNASGGTQSIGSFNVDNGKTGTIQGTQNLSLGNSLIRGNLNVNSEITSTGTFTVDAEDTYTLSGTHTHTGTDMMINGSLNLSGGSLVNNATGGSQRISTLEVDAGKTGTLDGTQATEVTTADIDGTFNYTATAHTVFNHTYLAGTLNQNSASRLTLTDLNIGDGDTGLISGAGPITAVDAILGNNSTLNNTNNTFSIETLTIRNDGNPATLGGTEAIDITRANFDGTLNFTATADTRITNTYLMGALNQNSASNLNLTNLEVVNGNAVNIGGTGTGNLSIETAKIKGDLNLSHDIISTGTFTVDAEDTYTLSGTHTHTGTDMMLSGSLNLSGGSLVNTATGGFQCISTLEVDTGKTGTVGGTQSTGVTFANIDGTLNFTATDDTEFFTANLAGILNQNSDSRLYLNILNVANGDTANINGAGTGDLRVVTSNISGDLNLSHDIISTGTFTVDAEDTYTLSGTHTHTGTDMMINGSLNLNDGRLVNTAAGGGQTISILEVDAGKTGTLGGTQTTGVTTANIDGTLDYTATADTTFFTTNLAGTLNQNSANELALSTLNIGDGDTGIIRGAGTLAATNAILGNNSTLDNANNTFSIDTLTINAGDSATLGGTEAIDLTRANIDGTLNFTATADTGFATADLAGTLNQNSAGSLTLTTLNVANGGAANISGAGTGNLSIETSNISGDLNLSHDIISTGTFTVDAEDTYTLSGTHTHTGTDMMINGSLNLSDGRLVNTATGGAQSISTLEVDTGKTGTLGGTQTTGVTTADIDGTLNFTATAETTFTTANLAGTLNQNSASRLNLATLNVDDGETGIISGTGTLAAVDAILGNNSTLNNANAGFSIDTLTINAGDSASLGGTEAIDLTLANIDGTLNFTATADTTFFTTNLAGTLKQNSANELALSTLNLGDGDTGTIGGTGTLAAVDAILGNNSTLNNANAGFSIETLTINAGNSASFGGTEAIDLTLADIDGTLNYTATTDTWFTNTHLAGTLNQNSAANLGLSILNIGDGETGLIGGTGILAATNAILGNNSILNNANAKFSIETLTINAGDSATLGGTQATDLALANIDGTLNYTATTDTWFTNTHLAGTLNQNSAANLGLSILNIGDGETGLIGGTGILTATNTILGNNSTLNNANAGFSIETLTINAGDSATLGGTQATDLAFANIDGTLNYTATTDTRFTNTHLAGTLNQNSAANLTLTSLNVAADKTAMISGAGAGDLIFTDAQVNGTLCIDRPVFANNPFVVGNTGILKLFHTITPGNKISNYGTLAVDAGDTATILGDYTQAGNGKIQVDAVSASSYGKVRVTGTADLSANNLINVNVTAHDTLAVNDALNAVLSANTLVVDQNRFEVEDNSAMWKFIPTFDNDMIDLTVLRQLTCAQAVNDSSQVSNPVAAGAAGVLDDLVVSGTVTPDMQAVLDEMGALQTGEQVAEAVAQTVPVLASASPQIGFDLAANGATQVVQNRLGGFSGMSAGDPVFEDQFVWVKPFYARTDQDKWNGIDGYKANAYGLAIGADGKINPEWRMGAAVSYGTADVQSDSIITRQQLDVETWQATLYANGDLGKYFTLNLVGALGFNQNDSSRNIVFGGLGRTALAEYDSLHTLVDAELVKTYAINDNLTLGASLGLDYIYICVDDYTETGAGALNLKVQGVNADTLVASIGGRLEYSITQNQRLTGQISLGYDLLADGSSLVSTYTGGGPSFVVTGNSPDEKVYQGGLGYELTCFRGMELLARYRVESRKHFFNQTGSINFRFPF